MNYRIEELGSFSIIGQEIELTNSRAQNIQLSTVFWKRFNINLKKYIRRYYQIVDKGLYKMNFYILKSMITVFIGIVPNRLLKYGFLFKAKRF